MSNMTEKVIFRADRKGHFMLYIERPADLYGRRCQSTRGPVNVKDAFRTSDPDPEEARRAQRFQTWQVVQRDTPATKKVRLAAAYVGEMKSGFETPNRAF